MRTRIIHKGRHYAACVLTCGGLVVEQRGKRGGRMLKGALASEWRDAIETADDKAEAEALCRAIMTA